MRSRSTVALNPAGPHFVDRRRLCAAFVICLSRAGNHLNAQHEYQPTDRLTDRPAGPTARSAAAGPRCRCAVTSFVLVLMRSLNYGIIVSPGLCPPLLGTTVLLPRLLLTFHTVIYAVAPNAISALYVDNVI